MLNLKAVEPLGMSDDVLGTFLGQYEVVSGVGAASRSLIIAFSQAFESILADGGEHEEARFFVDLFHLLHQTFIDHGSHAVEYVKAKIALGVAHGFRPFQSAAAGKDGKPAEESLLRRIEQAVTPVHGAAKSLLPGRQVAGTAGQQVQTAFEAGQHGGRRKQLDARCRQLDGQGQAIQASADGGHSGCIFPGEREFVLNGLRAFHKEGNGGKARKHFHRREAAPGW